MSELQIHCTRSDGMCALGAERKRTSNGRTGSCRCISRCVGYLIPLMRGGVGPRSVAVLDGPCASGPGPCGIFRDLVGPDGHTDLVLQRTRRGSRALKGWLPEKLLPAPCGTRSWALTRLTKNATDTTNSTRKRHGHLRNERG